MRREWIFGPVGAAMLIVTGLVPHSAMAAEPAPAPAPLPAPIDPALDNSYATEHADYARQLDKYRKRLDRFELAFQMLNAADAAQTISCINAGRCAEGNPLFGSHPTTASILLVKGAVGAAHFGFYRLLRADDPQHGGLIFEIVSGSAQGLVTGLNLRYTFH